MALNKPIVLLHMYCLPVLKYVGFIKLYVVLDKPIVFGLRNYLR